MTTPNTVRARRLLGAFAALVMVTTSCDEHLPSGPSTFATTIQIVVPHDTVVVGDSTAAQAQAVDAEGHTVQGLKFKWTSADPASLGVNAPTGDDGTAGRTQTLVGKKAGRINLTLSLPDSRFATADISRPQTVVVAGVRILSTKDSTLSAVSDTAMAIATSLVRTSAGAAPRASQGIKWSHLGSHVSIVGAGDTIRYVSRSNGADTLIASHDFCLAGARCADSAIVRVSQQLTMTLSTTTLLAWSFADSLAPVVKLADRRGSGLPGATVRLVPLTAADSLIVNVSGTVGTSNTADGTVATPRLIAIRNGSANVSVAAFGADNNQIGASQPITITVRQVARRVAVEPIHVDITTEDSIPFRTVARDARGSIIADATNSITTVGVNVHGNFAGPSPVGAATITPSVAGTSLPGANPLAPQVAVQVIPMQMNITASQSVVAGSAGAVVAFGGFAFDSTGQPANGRTVTFSVNAGGIPLDAVADANGAFGGTWFLPTVADHYTLTGALAGSTADPFGPIVLRRSITVLPDVPSTTKTTAAMSSTTLAVNATATLTVTVRDRFNNVVKTATLADFDAPTSTAGATISGGACTLGVCTFTYTAKATPGADLIHVRIAGSDVVNSPISITVQ